MKNSVRTAYLLTVLIVAMLPGAAYSENLIENGDFESQGADNRPEGWKVNKSRGTEAEVVLDKDEKRSGDRSLRISVEPPGGRVVVYLDDELSSPLTPGVPHEATFWVKTENIDYNQYRQAPAVRMNYRPQRIKPGGVIDLIAKTKGVTDWIKFKIQTPPALKNSRQIHFDILMTSGTLWIDAIEVRAVQ
ncbi:MAG: hypothetical protein ACLFML_00555 [Desulfobacterales bacterium]